MNQLQWYSAMMQLLMNSSSSVVQIPAKFEDQVDSLQKLLASDLSGIVSSLMDFAINTAVTEYIIETSNSNLSGILNDWLFDINDNLRGKIPTGFKAFARQYFIEMWLGSSLILTRTKWEDNGNFILPVNMWVMEGKDLVVNASNNPLKMIGDEQYSIRTSKSKVTPIPNKDNNLFFVQKPFAKWSEEYPVPFLIRKGVYTNLQILDLVVSKGANITKQALEYLALLKKGDIELTKTGNANFIYDKNDLTLVKEGLQKAILDAKNNNQSAFHAVNFDTELEHSIPDYSKVLEGGLFAPIEKRMLAGLGVVDIVQGMAGTRRESMMNPKPFISMITQGIEDLKTLLIDITKTIVVKNQAAHRKYFSKDVSLHVYTKTVPDFLSDDVMNHIRSMYDRGIISKRTYSEINGSDYVDFDVEVQRRTTEKDLTELMYPPVITNQESIPDMTDPNAPKGNPDLDKKRGFPPVKKETVPEDKTGIEKKNFVQSYYTSVDSLPESVSNLPTAAKLLWMKEFNDNFTPTREEACAEMAWKKVKGSFKKYKGEWEKKVNASIGEVDLIAKKIDVLEKQSKLLDNYLKSEGNND